MFDPFLEQLTRPARPWRHANPWRFCREAFKGTQQLDPQLALGRPTFRRWRVTRLDAGDSVQVLNSVAYPTVDRPADSRDRSALVRAKQKFGCS